MATRSSRSGKARPLAGGPPVNRTPANRAPAGAAGHSARPAVAPRPVTPRPAPSRTTTRETAAPVDHLQVLYGRNPVREALRGRRPVHELVVVEGHAGEEYLRGLGSWAAAAGAELPPVRRMAETGLSAWLRTDEHQGVAVRTGPYPYLEPEELLASRTLLVALDEVQDPHNLGAIIRTAEGAGAGVVIPRHRAAEITAAVVKASAGASEHASVSQVRNLADFLFQAKEAGFWIYGTAAGASSEYNLQDYRYPTCFVMGSEGSGLGRRVGSLCDVMISLPLIGQVESLNVSVTAGILLYEALRQRSAQDRVEP